jgi:nucleoside-diphosphate-sugar epimerase
MMSDKNDQLRVMVTGANGFVGKALTDFLTNNDIQAVPCIRKLRPETDFGWCLNLEISMKQQIGKRLYQGSR